MKYKFMPFFIILFFMKSYSEDYSLKNTSTYFGMDKWNWTIYIGSDTSDVKKISKVLYHFPEFYSRDTISIFTIEDSLHPFCYRGSSLGSFEIKAVLYNKKNMIIDTLIDSLVFQSKKIKNNSFSLKYELDTSSLKYTVYVHNINTMKIYDVLVVKYIIPKVIGLGETEAKEISLRGHDLKKAFSIQSFYSQDYEIKAEIYLKDGTYIEKALMIKKED